VSAGRGIGPDSVASNPVTLFPAGVPLAGREQLAAGAMPQVRRVRVDA
jgi:hypothetical protein